MSLPILASPVNDPIAIDPGVTYSYVIPQQGATSMSVLPTADFDASLSFLSFTGPAVLSLRFKGTPPPSPTHYPITVKATNPNGTVSQTLQFSVGLGVISATPTRIKLTTTSPLTEWAFDGDPVLRVNDVIIASNGQQVKVTSVNVSAGTLVLDLGAGIQFSSSGVYYFNVSASNATNDVLWVGDTLSLSVGQAIQLALDPAIANSYLPSALKKTVYVKDIVGQWHIRVSATLGGSSINPGAICFTTGKVIVANASTVRQYPNITSIAGSTYAQGASVVLPVTTDIAADSYSVSNLPSGLSLSGALISGVLPSVDRTYPVILSATLNGHTYRRYWMLVVGAGSALISGSAGIIAGGIPVSGSGIYYDGVYTVAQQAGPPIFIIPFKCDPKPYLYRVRYWQFVASYTPTTLGEAGPFGGVSAGEVPGSFKDVGGGVIEFEREFTFRPANRDEWESFVYSFQFIWTTYTTTGANDGDSTYNIDIQQSVFELPETVQSRVEYEYTETADPKSITLLSAPRLVGSPAGVYDLHSYLSYQPGNEILAQDETMKKWSGNIYERTRRFVVMQSIGQIVQ